jgi:hypothetical protein
MFINLTPEQAAKIEAELMKPGGVMWLSLGMVPSIMPAPKREPERWPERKRP